MMHNTFGVDIKGKSWSCHIVKGGGVQGNIFGRISFELWALQVPLVIGETFGEVPGPRRPTVSEPRPAQKLGTK